MNPRILGCLSNLDTRSQAKACLKRERQVGVLRTAKAPVYPFILQILVFSYSYNGDKGLNLYVF